MSSTEVNDTALDSLETRSRAEIYGPVGLNPLRHIVEGTKNLFTTNALAAIGMTVLYIACLYAISLPVSNAMGLWNMAPAANGTPLPQMGGFFAAVGLYYVASFLLYATIFQALTRLVITGTRLQRESFLHALSIALRRMGTAIVTFLAVGGIMLLIWVVTIILGAILGTFIPPLALLVLLIGFCAIIVAAFRLMYVSPILADDVKDIHVGDVLRASGRLWRVSRGAVLCYVAPLFVLGITITLIIFVWMSSNGLLQPNSAAYHRFIAQNHAFHGLGVGYVINIIVYSAISLAIGAGLADIYNRAKEHL